MEKFMQAINRAKELKIPMAHRFEHEGILRMFLEDSLEGKRRREREIEYLKLSYTKAIMNSRDERVSMQRELAKLTDIEIWEPENFTKEMCVRANMLRKKIANHKVKEVQYINAKEELI